MPRPGWVALRLAMRMIDPRPAGTMARPACLTVRNTPLTHRSMIRCQSARVWSTSRAAWPAPALATATSTRPQRSSAPAKSPSTSPSSVTSAVTHTWSPSAAASASSPPPSMSAATTVAPASTNRPAMARPGAGPAGHHGDLPGELGSLLRVGHRCSPFDRRRLGSWHGRAGRREHGVMSERFEVQVVGRVRGSPSHRPDRRRLGRGGVHHRGRHRRGPGRRGRRPGRLLAPRGAVRVRPGHRGSDRGGSPTAPRQPGMAAHRDLRPAGQEPDQPVGPVSVPDPVGRGHHGDVEGLDAVDGTPVLDLKPWLDELAPIGPTRQPGWATELMAHYHDRT